MDGGGGSGCDTASADAVHVAAKKHDALLTSAPSASSTKLSGRVTTPPLLAVSKEDIVHEDDFNGEFAKPSPTSVDDVFELFPSEETDDVEPSSMMAFPTLTQKELAQHRINISKLIGNVKYKEDLELMDMGTKRVENLHELEVECSGGAAASAAAVLVGSGPSAGASKLANIIRQKEYLLVKLCTRLSGVTRKLAKKERDVDKLKAEFQEMKDKHRTATKSDRKHIEELCLLAGKLRKMEEDLKMKENVVKQLRSELESSKAAHQAELVALEEARATTIQQYSDDVAKLQAKIQEVEESRTTGCLEMVTVAEEKDGEAEREKNIIDLHSRSAEEATELRSISEEVHGAFSALFCCPSNQSQSSRSEKNVASLKAQIDEMKRTISNMEKDISHKDSELFEVTKILFTDDRISTGTQAIEVYQGEEASVSKRVTALLQDLNGERSRSTDMQRTLDDLKLEVEHLQQNLAKTEEDLFERNIEISGVRSLLEDNSFLLDTGSSVDDGVEQAPGANMSIYDSTLQLVSELSTERDRSAVAMEKVVKLEEEVERLTASLDRIQELEMELGKKDLTMKNLSDQLMESRVQASEEIATLKQTADEESSRLKARMATRIAELQADHTKVSEELEVKLQERDEELGKLKISFGESTAAHSMQLASKENLEREIESLKKKATKQKISHDDRIVEMERETEARISQMKAAHEKVCDDLRGFIKTMEARLAKVKSVPDEADGVLFVESADVSADTDKSAQTLVSDLKTERDLNQQQKDEAKKIEVDLMAKIDMLHLEKSQLETELNAVKNQSIADITSIRDAVALEGTKNETRIRELELKLCCLEEGKSSSLEEATGGHQQSVKSLQASIESLESSKCNLLEQIAALQLSVEEAKTATAATDNLRAMSEEKVRCLEVEKDALEAHHRALETKTKSKLLKAEKDLQDANIKALEGQRDTMVNEIRILKEALDLAEAKPRADASEKLHNQAEAISALENRIKILRSEREAADERHRREMESQKLSSNDALEAAIAKSVNTADELKHMREVSQNLEKEVTLLRLENEGLLAKMQDVVSSKDRKIIEAMAGVEKSRVSLASLEQENSRMSALIRSLERELKMSKARSMGDLLTTRTEVETLRSALADAKRKVADKEIAKQNDIDSLREQYQSKIDSLEEGKEKLNRQLFDLHIAIVGTAKAVALDMSSSDQSSCNEEDHDRIAALRAQKEVTIKQVRAEMQEALEAKEEELGVMRRKNAVSCERIASLELLLEVKEGELIDLKRAFAEKSFYENAAAYDESDEDDDETLVCSPTRSPRKGSYNGHPPQDCEIFVPLASRQSAARVVPLHRLIMNWLCETLFLLCIHVPLKAAKLSVIVCLASLMLLWFGAAIAILWTYLANDNGAMKIGAAVDYGNGVGFGLYNI